MLCGCFTFFISQAAIIINFLEATICHVIVFFCEMCIVLSIYCRIITVLTWENFQCINHIEDILVIILLGCVWLEGWMREKRGDGWRDLRKEGIEEIHNPSKPTNVNLYIYKSK